ncbi:MAG: SDR family NAD(P)-dependent oxidoreductase [Cyclobacteriaceae bacterium]
MFVHRYKDTLFLSAKENDSIEHYRVLSVSISINKKIIMSKFIVIGGSKGIGFEVLSSLLENHECVNISRTEADISNSNLTQYQADVLTDYLPDIDGATGLIYCPGSINLKPISTLKEDHFKTDFEINVLGAIKAIKKYAPVLKKSPDASIVLFSTVAVGQGMPFHASVAASKGAVEGLTKSLAAEFAPTIRVNCVAPTITDTPLASNILKNEKVKENMIAKHPLKKILSAKEVANTATFLLSNAASGMTGQIIGVDAGLSTLKV